MFAIQTKKYLQQRTTNIDKQRYPIITLIFIDSAMNMTTESAAKQMRL